MIRIRCILHIQGLFLTVLGAAMLAPLAIAPATSWRGADSMAIAWAATTLCGLLLWRCCRSHPQN